MNANDFYTEQELELAFREGINRFSPPTGLKEAIRQRLFRHSQREVNALPLGSTLWKTNRKELIVKIVKWFAPGLAACAAIVVIGLLLANGSSNVYAQATQAIEQARTVHAQYFNVIDGETVKWAEIWYEANRGIREWTKAKDGTISERLDDGQFQWTYNSASGTAVKTKSHDPVGAVASILRPKPNAMFDELIEKTKRLRQADIDIRGVACEAHVTEQRVFNETQLRWVLWIDDQQRGHRSEEQRLVAGQWVADARCEVTYDRPLPDDRLKPQFGPSVEIVDLVDSGPFNVKESLLQGTVLGLVLAVHEVERLGNGSVLLMWSIRPTQDTLQQFGTITPRPGARNVYGDAVVESDWKRVRWVKPMEIARWTFDGIQTNWTILIPRGGWDRPIQAIDLQFSVHSRGKLQQALRKDGQQWYVQKFRLGELSLPEKAVPMNKVCRQVYERVAWAEAQFGGQLALTGRTRSLTEEEKQEQIEHGGATTRETEKAFATSWHHAPSRIAPEQFIKDVEANYERLMK